MKKILITGKADKRIISYPLMNICNSAGKTCLVTDDVNYKRLYAGYERQGDIDNVHIEIIPPVTEDTNMDEIIKGKEDFGYDILIMVLDACIVKDIDHIYIVANQIQTFMGIEIEEVLDENKESTAFAVSLVKRKVPEHTIPFIWNMDDFVYMCSVEESRKLLPPRNKKLTELLQNSICSSVGIPLSTYNGLSGKAQKQKRKKK